MQDIKRVFAAINEVVEAGGIAVDFAAGRHGRDCYSKRSRKKSRNAKSLDSSLNKSLEA